MSGGPVGLIPARGGSKRFRRKNLAPLRGRPLLAWTVEPALASGVFEDVVVSSEDPEVLAVAGDLGARPLPRPGALAGDRTTVEELCLHLMSELGLAAAGGALYVLLPTSPLRRPETIREAWGTFRGSGADALVSVLPLAHPPQWALAVRDGLVEPLHATLFPTPRPDLEPAYRHDGGHVILDAASFAARGAIFGGRTLAFQAPEDETADVDEPRDLAWVEFLLERRAA